MRAATGPTCHIAIASISEIHAPLDVSVTIRPEMPIYDGNPGVSIELVQSLERGDSANVSRLELGVHTGTHVDAPRHFLPDEGGADELPVELFVGPCVVVDAAADGAIDGTVISSLDLPPGTERVLLKTRNSELWDRPTFTRDFVRLDGSGAKALIERGVLAVGIDYLSIGDRDAHVTLLTSGAGVIEGLDLRAVDPGSYFLTCLPLKVARSDGAPARALLWPQLS